MPNPTPTAADLNAVGRPYPEHPPAEADALTFREYTEWLLDIRTWWVDAAEAHVKASDAATVYTPEGPIDAPATLAHAAEALRALGNAKRCILRVTP